LQDLQGDELGASNGNLPNDRGTEIHAKVGPAGQSAVLQLPCIVRVLNLVLFGEGRCWAMPVLLLVIMVAKDFLHFKAPGDAGMDLRFHAGAVTWSNSAIAAEFTANLYFGYRFCRRDRITQLVHSVAASRGVTERYAMRALGRCVWTAVATAVAALVGWVLWMPERVGANAPATTVAGYVIGVATSYLAMLYLCALWLWTNWLFWRAGRSVVERGITANSVVQRRASVAVFGLLDEMRSVSQVWTVNHAVRAVTTVNIAESELQLGNEYPGGRAYAFTVAAVLLLVVLATAAAPGYVTTSFYKEVQCKLAAVAHADADDSDGELGFQHPKDTPTALMQRIAAAGCGTGMQFAGIPMTVEKTITVATIIFYFTRYFATPACAASCVRELTTPQPWWNGTAVVYT
jgi:hypothetical protein